MSGALRIPPVTDARSDALGVARALVVQLDRVVQRVVTLHPEFSDNHVHRLRGELTMFEKALDEITRELQSQAIRLASRLAAGRTP